MMDAVIPELNARKSRENMNNELRYCRCIEKIANHYGVDSQISKLVEEADELKDAAIEYREDPAQKTREHLAEEIADVQVMIDQLTLLLDIKTLVWHAQEYKIGRQLDRIKREASKS